MNSLRYFLVITALSLPLAGFGAQDQPAGWTTNVKFSEIGQADLDRTYSQLLDFLFPRKLVNPAQTKCSFVLRFLPADGSEHQLNILVPEGSSNIQILRLELKDSLQSRLVRSDPGQEIARSSVVKKAEFAGNTEVRKLVERAKRSGLSIQIPPGVAIHGNTYKLWMSCELNRAEMTAVVPKGVHTPASDWMNALWSEAVKLNASPTR